MKAAKNCIKNHMDEAEEAMGSIENMGALITRTRGLVEEWYEQQNKALCVAVGGKAYAAVNDAASVEGGIFSSIEDQLGETTIYSYLMSALDRMEQLLEAGRAG